MMRPTCVALATASLLVLFATLSDAGPRERVAVARALVRVRLDAVPDLPNDFERGAGGVNVVAPDVGLTLHDAKPLTTRWVRIDGPNGTDIEVPVAFTCVVFTDPSLNAMGAPVCQPCYWMDTTQFPRLDSLKVKRLDWVPNTPKPTTQTVYVLPLSERPKWGLDEESAYPQIVFYDRDAKQIYRTTGALTAEEFARRLGVPTPAQDVRRLRPGEAVSSRGW